MDVGQQKYFRLKLEGKLKFVKSSLNKPGLITYLKKHKTEVEIPEIEKAIARIDDGKYGMCEDCNNGISSQRLEVRPETRFCAECLSRKEGGKR